MAQKPFSIYILLIGMVLIFYNSCQIIFRLGYQIIALLASFAWSILLIICKAVFNYPITLTVLLWLAQRKKSLKFNQKNSSFAYELFMEAFAQNIECSICLEDNVDKVLVQCGHFYHIKCIDPWIRKSEQCPFCRARVPKTDLNYKNNLKALTLKHLFNSNKKKLVCILLVSMIIALKYNAWWNSLHIINWFNNDSVQLSDEQCPSTSKYFLEQIQRLNIGN